MASIRNRYKDFIRVLKVPLKPNSNQERQFCLRTCLKSSQIRRVHAYIKWRIWLYYEQFRPFKSLKFLHPLGEIKNRV